MQATEIAVIFNNLQLYLHAKRTQKSKQKQKQKHACKILLQQLHEAYITRKMHAFSIVGNFPLYFYTQAAYIYIYIYIFFFLTANLKKIVSLISLNHIFQIQNSFINVWKNLLVTENWEVTVYFIQCNTAVSSVVCHCVTIFLFWRIEPNANFYRILISKTVVACLCHMYLIDRLF